MKKKKVLFVGSFKTTSKDGGVGGQMFACKTIVNSPISDSINWTLIDTTADSNILASTDKRVRKAIIRLIKFTYYILFFKYDYVLIFVADGWSFWEKGLMTVIAKYFSNSKVIIAPRSGFIINDIDKEGLLSKFIKFVFRKTDVIICQSNYWKGLFEKSTLNKNNPKFVIIENMIDFDKYAELPIRNVKENEKVTILFMAWVTRNKGIFELIEAIKMLKKENFNFKVLIAGKGDDYEEINNELKLADLTNEVTLKGWVLGEKKLAILAESDIFILPTYFDGYPNSLLEAMASGKACVATNVGSIPDMLNNMETGILIDKKNHDQLFQGLKTLIQSPDLRREMSLKARVHVKETNSISSGISKFQNLFK
jgi:glycosyltransferase involved in cell wall biosynthesis